MFTEETIFSLLVMLNSVLIPSFAGMRIYLIRHGKKKLFANLDTAIIIAISVFGNEAALMLVFAIEEATIFILATMMTGVPTGITYLSCKFSNEINNKGGE